MRLLCELLGVARSSASDQPQPREDRLLRDALIELAGQWPTSGSRRLTIMLQRQGLAVHTKRVRRLLHELGLAAEPPQRKPRTTASAPSDPRFPNRVEGLAVSRPEPVWVADITSLRLRKEFIYLAVLMDVLTRSMRGWHLGRSLEHELTIVALKRALERGCPEIHHSDQGVP